MRCGDARKSGARRSPCSTRLARVPTAISALHRYWMCSGHRGRRDHRDGPKREPERRCGHVGDRGDCAWRRGCRVRRRRPPSVYSHEVASKAGSVDNEASELPHRADGREWPASPTCQSRRPPRRGRLRGPGDRVAVPTAHPRTRHFLAGGRQPEALGGDSAARRRRSALCEAAMGSVLGQGSPPVRHELVAAAERYPSLPKRN